MDATRIKERFLQIAHTARGLLSDFREVEQNFRELDRAVRERIATWEGGKGELLEEIFGDRDAIVDSDQGKSFRAFWDFLMSPVRQEELTDLLSKVFELEPVKELQPDRRLLRVHYDWLQAGEVAQRTVARLSEQLRRYLDDKAWLENRRIMQILREVEQTALSIRDRPPDGPIMALDEPAPDIDLTMDRPLFEPPLKPQIAERGTGGSRGHSLRCAVRKSSTWTRSAWPRTSARRCSCRSQVSLDRAGGQAPAGARAWPSWWPICSLAAEDSAALIDDDAAGDVGVDRRRGHAAPGHPAAGDLLSPLARCHAPDDRRRGRSPNALSLVLVALHEGRRRPRERRRRAGRPCSTCRPACATTSPCSAWS